MPQNRCVMHAYHFVCLRETCILREIVVRREGGREREECVCVGKGLGKFHLYIFFLTKTTFQWGDWKGWVWRISKIQLSQFWVSWKGPVSVSCFLQGSVKWLKKFGENWKIEFVTMQRPDVLNSRFT